MATRKRDPVIVDEVQRVPELLSVIFWRTRAGLEVDFVVYGEGGFWAVEVKNTGRVRPEDLRSLEAFAAEYPECTPLLVYRGQERLRAGNVWCIPAQRFLGELHPSRSLTARRKG